MLRLLKVPLPLNSATLLQAKSFPETLIQVIDLLRVIPRSIQKYTNYPTCVQWPQNAGHRLGTVCLMSQHFLCTWRAPLL